MHSAPEEMQGLPDDIGGLRALLLTTTAERDAALSEHDTLREQNDRLCHLLQKLLPRLPVVSDDREQSAQLDSSR
jgi:hypothetical protein